MNKVADGKLAFAKIHIDIKGKKAIFDYPEGTPSGIYMIVDIALFTALLWAVPCLVLMACYNLSMGTQYAASTELLVLPPISFALAVYLFHKDEMSKLAAAYEGFIKGEKRLHVHEVKGREYVLPSFKNFMLDYKLQGDFAEKLLTIDIVPVKYGIENPRVCTWQAIFKFRRKPTGGCMYLKFI